MTFSTAEILISSKGGGGRVVGLNLNLVIAQAQLEPINYALEVLNPTSNLFYFDVLSCSKFMCLFLSASG